MLQAALQGATLITESNSGAQCPAQALSDMWTGGGADTAANPVSLSQWVVIRRPVLNPAVLMYCSTLCLLSVTVFCEIYSFTLVHFTSEAMLMSHELK